MASMLAPQSYEEERILDTYILFHYGSPEQQLGSLANSTALDPTLIASLKCATQYPVETVRKLIDASTLGAQADALDIGCALGRSSFELAEFCHSVLGIDFSKSFVESAQRITRGECLQCHRIEEGGRVSSIEIQPELSERISERVRFEQGDAHALNSEIKSDVVHASNLLCRLKEPKLFLSQLPKLLKPGGQLLISSPYSWLEQYTNPEDWIGGTNNLDSAGALKSELAQLGFELELEIEIPFLIREHSRKFQFSLAHAMRLRLKD